MLFEGAVRSSGRTWVCRRGGSARTSKAPADVRDRSFREGETPSGRMASPRGVSPERGRVQISPCMGKVAYRRIARPFIITLRAVAHSSFAAGGDVSLGWGARAAQFTGANRPCSLISALNEGTCLADCVAP